MKRLQTIIGALIHLWGVKLDNEAELLEAAAERKRRRARNTFAAADQLVKPWGAAALLKVDEQPAAH